MGRRKKTEVEEAVKPARSNGYEPERVQETVARAEALFGDIGSIMGKALSDCRVIHGEINDVLDTAKNTYGIPKKIIRKVLKARALERKAADVRENLEGDDQNDYDMIRHALGDLADTPLGQAATSQFNPPDTAEQPFAPQ